jgi:hypothetical protein
VLLQWVGDGGANFQVQWATSPDAGSWFTFSQIATSATGEFTFLDDGSESGGLEEPRFYRLLRVP